MLNMSGSEGPTTTRVWSILSVKSYLCCCCCCCCSPSCSCYFSRNESPFYRSKCLKESCGSHFCFVGSRSDQLGFLPPPLLNSVLELPGAHADATGPWIASLQQLQNRIGCVLWQFTLLICGCQDTESVQATHNLIK
jgi:hypothetical protein